MQLLQLQTHLHAQFGIEVGERLIKQEYRRVAHDSPPHRHALALAAGEFARTALQQAIQLQNARRFLDTFGN